MTNTKFSIKDLMRCRRATLVTATYANNGALETIILAGPNKTPAVPDLEEALSEEGVYIIYLNRALQIGAPCERRGCSNGSGSGYMICRCARQESRNQGIYSTERDNGNGNGGANPQINNDFAREIKSKCVRSRVQSWLHLSEAADSIRRSTDGMCFLLHPRALTLDNTGIAADLAFYFDEELEEFYSGIYSVQSYAPTRAPAPSLNNLAPNSTPPTPATPAAPATPPPTPRTPSTPITPKHITPTSTPTNKHREKGLKECPPGFIELVRDAWQDFLESGDYHLTPTPPPTPTSTSNMESEMDDFVQVTTPTHNPFARTRRVAGDGGGGEEDAQLPIPVIIPPENMRVGRGLG